MIRLFERYKWFFLLLPIFVIILLTFALIMLSSGPQAGAFVYQVH